MSSEDKEKLGGTTISQLSELQEIENVAVHRKVCITGKIISVSRFENVKSKSGEKSFRNVPLQIRLVSVDLWFGRNWLEWLRKGNFTKSLRKCEDV